MTALLFGSVLIILTDFDNLSRLGDRTCRRGPSAWSAACGRGYGAMLTGAFGDPARILAAISSGNANDIATAIRPFTETLVAATPLIFTGLGVAISFRGGMFNIGGDGQLMLGALAATIVAIVLAGQVPAAAILILVASSRPRSRAACGASFPGSSRRGPARTRSSRRSCSTTSPR